MKLDAVEFIRRFLLHVLPAGFVKIRHFGLLADRNRSQALPLGRIHLHATPQSMEPSQAGDYFYTATSQRSRSVL